MLLETITQPAMLLLFAYLGLVSGLIFYLFFNLQKKFFFVLKKIYKFKLNKETRNIKTKKKSTKNADKNGQENKKRDIFIKLKQPIKIFFKKIIRVVCSLNNAVLLSLLVFVSYLINLYFNFGYIRPVFIVMWIIFFVLGKSLFKLLAKFVLNFYNIFSKRKNLNAK